MEMHQIRYFLAVTRTLNFTRAAEECNVAQPSLTRAVKLLEEELGGELFRRERTHSHLTELGSRMLPFLRQSYEAALAAREMAKSLKKGEAEPLRLLMSRTVPVDLVVDKLVEVQRAFPGLELKLIRADAGDLVEIMKKGDADLLISGPLAEDWERFDHWPLLTEPQLLVVASHAPFKSDRPIGLDDLKQARLLLRPYCEQVQSFTNLLKERGLDAIACHSVSSERDFLSLVEAGIGVGFLPMSYRLPETLRRVAVTDVDFSRTISLTAVAGRPRSPAATALLNLLRSADWSEVAA
ncbi:MAG: LysR family transcriptional regulator [Hyphomicrobiaceae bacterium]